MISRSSASLLCIALAVTACTDLDLASDPSDDLTDDLGTVEAALGCSSTGCGLNSPDMGNGIVFHEIDISGVLRNDVGVRYDSMVKAGQPLQILVDRHFLRARRPDGMILQPGGLVGAIIKLRHGLDTYSLKVDSVNEIAFWFGAVGREVPIYRFLYRRDGSPDETWTPLCRGLGLGKDRGWEGIEQIAIVFRGDRYDGRTKRVTATGAATGNWVNIACAGSALAKEHLMRHTDAGSTPLYQTAVAQRQAMLKMFTADYCGTGTPFTVMGQPLLYMDANNWYPFNVGSASSVESIWDENGAVCLDIPRLLAQDRTILTQIRRECPLKPMPSCRPSMATWQSRGHVLSANP